MRAQWRSANLRNLNQHYDDVYIFESKSAGFLGTRPTLTDDDEAVVREAVVYL